LTPPGPSDPGLPETFILERECRATLRRLPGRLCRSGGEPLDLQDEFSRRRLALAIPIQDSTATCNHANIMLKDGRYYFIDFRAEGSARFIMPGLSLIDLTPDSRVKNRSSCSSTRAAAGHSAPRRRKASAADSRTVRSPATCGFSGRSGFSRQGQTPVQPTHPRRTASLAARLARLCATVSQSCNVGFRSTSPARVNRRPPAGSSSVRCPLTSDR
jgi:hypothetical protein